MAQYGNQKNVTFIDELLEIDDIEKQGSRYQNSNNNNHQMYDKAYGRPLQEPSQSQLNSKIRQATAIPYEAGMSLPHQYQAQQNQPINQYTSPNYLTEPTPVPSSQLSCIDVAEHIKNCPICSKLYKNDNTIYIIVIIVLVIICILLLKRVLDI